jgi:aminoglycoside phosphotransferase (APT) family kinase protein
VAVLPEPDPDGPVLVHLDAFLGNMLAAGDRVTALLDFGPMAIAGVRDLDPLVAVAYLAPEITPTAVDADRAVALAWANDAGLADAVDPAERWIAAYWTGAPDDARLRQWCARILLDR